MLNFDNFAVLTFDCYGTLIDWETGILAALRPILQNHHIELPDEELLELYGSLEAAAEAIEYHEYETVLKMVLTGIGLELDFTPSYAELHEFAQSVGRWPAFSDSALALQALQQKYKLAVISNIDDASFKVSAQQLAINFDWVITAQRVRSYKPALRNFELALAEIGLPPGKVLHIAQSLYHDIAPAQALGLSTVWVNRRQDQKGHGATPPAEAQPDFIVPDLKTLVTQLGLA
jgi:2-haloacid dehalogenase